VHSHVRRALVAGASGEEIQHSLLLLTSTIGFPTTMAALSWAEEILLLVEKKYRTKIVALPHQRKLSISQRLGQPCHQPSS